MTLQFFLPINVLSLRLFLIDKLVVLMRNKLHKKEILQNSHNRESHDRYVLYMLSPKKLKM